MGLRKCQRRTSEREKNTLRESRVVASAALSVATAVFALFPFHSAGGSVLHVIFRMAVSVQQEGTKEGGVGASYTLMRSDVAEGGQRADVRRPVAWRFNFKPVEPWIGPSSAPVSELVSVKLPWSSSQYLCHRASSRTWLEPRRRHSLAPPPCRGGR